MPAGLLNELTFEPLAEGLQLSFHSSRWEAGECPVVMRYARVSRAERRILLAAVLCVNSRSKSRRFVDSARSVRCLISSLFKTGFRSI
jgi:hypothetical protein